MLNSMDLYSHTESIIMTDYIIVFLLLGKPQLSPTTSHQISKKSPSLKYKTFDQYSFQRKKWLNFPPLRTSSSAIQHSCFLFAMRSQQGHGMPRAAQPQRAPPSTPAMCSSQLWSQGTQEKPVTSQPGTGGLADTKHVSQGERLTVNLWEVPDHHGPWDWAADSCT